MTPNHKIIIDGKPVYLSFGYTCYTTFLTSLFKFRETYMSDNGLTGLGLSKLFHCAYLNYCYKKEVEPELDYDHFAEWVTASMTTEAGWTEINVLIEAWAASKEVKKMLEDVKVNEATEEEKKSLISTPSTESSLEN